MIIKKATIDDMKDIIAMARAFHQESAARKYTLTNERIKELTSSWRPYQGLVYFHLLLNNLQAKGLV